MNNAAVLFFSIGVITLLMAGFVSYAEAKTLYFDSSGDHCDDSTGKPFFCSISAAADAVSPGDIIQSWPQGPLGEVSDINGDGVVDASDTGLITSNWGIPSDSRADITYDGVVDAIDFSIFMYRWQKEGVSVIEKVPFSLPSALTARLSISPNSRLVTVGESFSSIIKINAESADVNAVEATVHFPKDMLQVASISKDNSIFDVWPIEPVYSNEEGTIHFVGGTNSIFNGSSGTVLEITFVAKEIGAAQVSLGAPRIIRKGSDIMRGVTGAVYAINFPSAIPITKKEVIPPEVLTPTPPIVPIREEVQTTKGVGKEPPTLFDVGVSPGPAPKDSLLTLIIVVLSVLVSMYVIYRGIRWHRRKKREQV